MRKTTVLFFLFNYFAILLAFFPVAFAQTTYTVTNGDDTGSGSLRDILGGILSTGDTIDFDVGVTTIDLTDGQISQSAANLTITGNGSGSATAFQDALQALITDVQANGTAGLQNGLDALPYSTTMITGTDVQTGITGGSTITGGLINLTATTGTHNLSLLTFKDNLFSATTADSTDTRLEFYGGTISLDGVATLNQMAFLNNNLLAQSGTTTINSNVSSPANVDALADAHTYGFARVDGGCGFFNGPFSWPLREIVTIENTVFSGNITNAIAGTVVASASAEAHLDASASASVTASAYAVADAYANVNGGGGYFGYPIDTQINNSVFSDNTINAIGGTVTVNAYAKGYSDTGTPVNLYANANANATADAGAEAAGGGAYFYNNATIENTVFSNNTINATAGTAMAYAEADAETSASISTQASTHTDASVYGGGGFFGNTATIKNTVFSGNTVNITTGAATSIGIFSRTRAQAFVQGGGGFFGGNTTIENSIFSDNTINAITGMADISTINILGGGGFFGNTTIDNTVFSGNSINATGGTGIFALVEITGGGGFFGGNTTIANTVFSGNTINATGRTAVYEAHINIFGGGGSFYSNTTIENTLFSGNTINAAGGTATSSDFYTSASAYVNIRGGGGYFKENTIIENSVFSGNLIHAIGGVKATGRTSGMYDWANADAYAFGGGMYIEGATNTLTNVTFEGNQIYATASGEVVQQTPGAYNGPAKAYALGAAIFVNNYTPNNKLDLIADGGTVLISGNTANGTPSGIHFGRAYSNNSIGYFDGSAASSTLNIIATNLGDKVLMYDPLTVEVYHFVDIAKFAMNVSGAGDFVWGGKNILDASGGSTITLESGSTTTLTRDFTLTTTPNIDYRVGSFNDAYAMASNAYPGTSLNPLSVVLETGSTLNFNLARNENLAMFDFTNSTAGEFTVGSNVDFGIADTTRQIVNVNKSYLIADGIAQAEADAGENNFNLISPEIQGFEIRDNIANGSKQLWTSVKFNSPYASLFAKNRNSESASTALNGIVNHFGLVSDEEFDLIIKNINAVTPEYALIQADMLSRTTWRIADWATYDGFRRPRDLRVHRSMRGILRGASPSAVTRTWGSYVGDFVNSDSHNRLQGYNSEMNGLLVGADRTWGTTSLGLYLAGTQTGTHFDGIHSSADSNSFHFGLMGRKVWRKFIAGTFDVGYAHYETDGYRGIGGGYFAQSSFDGDAFTSGIGLEWDLTDRSETLGITPFARLRYTRFAQDGFSEISNSGTATNMAGINNDSFQSVLGIELERQYSKISSSIRVAWRHEYANQNFTGTAAYQMLPNTPFVMNSLGRDRDALSFGTDLRTNFASYNANLGYNLEASSNMVTHGVYAKLEKKW